MTLRMHPVSASRWAQLAATRLPIDLVAETSKTPTATATTKSNPPKARRLQTEHAEIQARVDSLASARIRADR